MNLLEISVDIRPTFYGFCSESTLNVFITINTFDITVGCNETRLLRDRIEPN